jgi:hypothetical protein
MIMHDADGPIDEDTVMRNVCHNCNVRCVRHDINLTPSRVISLTDQNLGNLLDLKYLLT